MAPPRCGRCPHCLSGFPCLSAPPPCGQCTECLTGFPCLNRPCDSSHDPPARSEAPKLSSPPVGAFAAFSLRDFSDAISPEQLGRLGAAYDCAKLRILAAETSPLYQELLEDRDMVKCLETHCPFICTPGRRPRLSNESILKLKHSLWNQHGGPRDPPESHSRIDYHRSSTPAGFGRLPQTSVAQSPPLAANNSGPFSPDIVCRLELQGTTFEDWCRSKLNRHPNPHHNKQTFDDSQGEEIGELPKPSGSSVSYPMASGNFYPPPSQAGFHQPAAQMRKNASARVRNVLQRAMRRRFFLTRSARARREGKRLERAPNSGPHTERAHHTADFFRIHTSGLNPQTQCSELPTTPFDRILLPDTNCHAPSAESSPPDSPNFPGRLPGQGPDVLSNFFASLRDASDAIAGGLESQGSGADTPTSEPASPTSPAQLFNSQPDPAIITLQATTFEDGNDDDDDADEDAVNALLGESYENLLIDGPEENPLVDELDVDTIVLPQPGNPRPRAVSPSVVLDAAVEDADETDEDWEEVDGNDEDPLNDRE